MRIKIIKPIKNFNREECGEVVLTDKMGSLLEFTSLEGFVSYISKSRFNKLKTQNYVKASI